MIFIGVKYISLYCVLPHCACFKLLSDSLFDVPITALLCFGWTAPCGLRRFNSLVFPASKVIVDMIVSELMGSFKTMTTKASVRGAVVHVSGKWVLF